MHKFCYLGSDIKGGNFFCVERAVVSSVAYEFNEGSIPMPDLPEWEDRTVHALYFPTGRKTAATLVITRDSLPDGVNLSGYIEGEVSKLKKALPQFTEKGRVPVEWSDFVGEAVSMRWRSDEGLIDQVIACREVFGNQVLLFTITHPAPFPSSVYSELIRVVSGFVSRSKDGYGAPEEE